MNNEIKEINIKIPGQILDYVDTKEHLLDLFNYITNLQQLEQEHKKINGELREENSKLEIALQNIQEDYDRRIEENERLKEELQQEKKDFKEANDYCFELKDYKSRCKKAIDFVKSMEYCGQEDYFYDMKASDICGNDNTFEDSKNKLLNILQDGGEDK